MIDALLGTLDLLVRCRVYDAARVGCIPDSGSTVGRSCAVDTVQSELPLAGVRVVDLTDHRGASCGRLLAELGADVVLVEPPAGIGSRARRRRLDGTSIDVAVHHANQRSVTIDLETDGGREDLLMLLSRADIWIDGTDPGWLASRGVAPRQVLAAA